jgi:hypothetical protein
MAWKKNANGRFTPEQHDKIWEMHWAGLEVSEIADKAGCAWSTVQNSINKRSKKKEVGKKSGPPKVVVDALNRVNEDLSDERKYLLWALRGTLSKFEGQSYLDRLLVELKSGKFV